jgi:adenylate cyclase class 2
MPKTDHPKEIEVKLRVPEIDKLRAHLKLLRAREISPRTYESNTLYDTPRNSLRRHGRLIRIRIERPDKTFGKMGPIENAPAILTYKGPSNPPRNTLKARRRSEIRGHFKIKEEEELSVAGAGKMARILRVLGLHSVFRYEKFRTTYAFPGIRGLKVELDETPVGVYLELEGPVAAIDRGARLLGYTRQEYLKQTYGSLYLADCRRRGRKPGDMLFPPTKNLR